MDIGSNNDNSSDLNRSKSKKFVFMIYPENIKKIENLSYDEKNNLINVLISEYFNAKNNNQVSLLKLESTKNNFKKTLLLAVGIPLILIIITLSLHFTQKSYLDMQTKFQKLYNFSQSK